MGNFQVLSKALLKETSPRKTSLYRETFQLLSCPFRNDFIPPKGEPSIEKEIKVCSHFPFSEISIKTIPNYVWPAWGHRRWRPSGKKAVKIIDDSTSLIDGNLNSLPARRHPPAQRIVIRFITRDINCEAEPKRKNIINPRRLRSHAGNCDCETTSPVLIKNS